MKLDITIPKGYKFKSFNKETNSIELELIPKTIRDQIQNIDDIFRLNGTTRREFDEKWFGFKTYEKAQALEILIAAAYNKGKLPNFKDGTVKYYPRFKMGEIDSYPNHSFSYHCDDRGCTTLSVGSRLVFHGEDAEENMLDAVNKFLNVYRNSRTS